MRPVTRDASPAVSRRESRALKCQIRWFTPQTCLPHAGHRPRCTEIWLRIWRMEQGALSSSSWPPGSGRRFSAVRGGGHRRETSTEVQVREQAGRQREVGYLEVEVWAGGRAPHPVCLGKAARTASPVEANGQAGGASQRHRVRQEEGGMGEFDRGLATPQRFSTRGSQRQHQLGAEKV